MVAGIASYTPRKPVTVFEFVIAVLLLRRPDHAPSAVAAVVLLSSVDRPWQTAPAVSRGGRMCRYGIVRDIARLRDVSQRYQVLDAPLSFILRKRRDPRLIAAFWCHTLMRPTVGKGMNSSAYRRSAPVLVFTEMMSCRETAPQAEFQHPWRCGCRV